MTDSITRTCFLLTADYFDTADRFEMVLYAAPLHTGTPIKIIIDSFRPLFFVPSHTPESSTRMAAERKKLPLKSFDCVAVDCLYFKTLDACRSAARSLRERGVAVYESDVHPVERYLMERFIAGTFAVTGEAHSAAHALVFRNPHIRGCDDKVPLKVLSLDIETDEISSRIYCIAMTGIEELVFMIGSGIDSAGLRWCRDETQLLKSFFAHLKTEDPDVLIGWHVVGFDLAVIQKRCRDLNIPFDLGRERGAAIVPAGNDKKQMVARIPGRVVMDGPMMLRSGGHSFESFSLENVAGEVLDRHKMITLEGTAKTDEINRLFVEDKETLAEYNLQDTLLVREIFEKMNLLPNAIERSKRSGLTLDRYGGSVAAFDHMYLPRLHRAGYVAGDLADIPRSEGQLIGGFVIEPEAGIFENVLLFDFKSLYPSIMRTFSIDPLGMRVSGENMVSNPARTSSNRAIAVLPGIVAELLEARAQAKRDANLPLSYAIKILMNSFYGVLGSTGCRFFDPLLAESITLSGQFLLRATRDFIEKEIGWTVLYGDTDSLFVQLGPGREQGADDIGKDLIARVNDWLADMIRRDFDAESALELEYEGVFRKLLIPSMRSGGGKGTKKRYCGLVEKNGERELVFKGMESARSDWTDLAKDFQQNLYMKVFDGEDIDDYVRSVVANLRSGKLDAKLVYSKHLRKELDEYAGSVPPHVQAARMLEKPGSVIRYVITTKGPRPLSMQDAPCDYDHYVQSQLQPVADAILERVGKSFDDIASGQMRLF